MPITVDSQPRSVPWLEKHTEHSGTGKTAWQAEQQHNVNSCSARVVDARFAGPNRETLPPVNPLI